MPWDSRWEDDPMSLVDAEMSRLKSEIRVLTRERNVAEERMRKAEAVADDLDAALIEAHTRLEQAEVQVDQWERLWRSLPAAIGEWQKIDVSLKLTPSEREAING